MNEGGVDQQITAYLLNELSRTERDQFELEIMRNEVLRATVDEQRSFLSDLENEFAKEKLPQLNLGHRAAINKKLYGEEQLSFLQKLFSPRVGLSFATMSLVVAAIFITQQKFKEEPEFDSIVQSAPTTEDVVPAPPPAAESVSAAPPPLDQIAPKEETNLKGAVAQRAVVAKKKQEKQAIGKMEMYADVPAYKSLEKSKLGSAGAGGSIQDAPTSMALYDDLEEEVQAREKSKGTKADVGSGSAYRVEFERKTLEQFPELKDSEKELKICIKQNISKEFLGSIKIVFNLKFGADQKFDKIEAKNFDKAHAKLVACTVAELTERFSKVLGPSKEVDLPISFSAK